MARKPLRMTPRNQQLFVSSWWLLCAARADNHCSGPHGSNSLSYTSDSLTLKYFQIPFGTFKHTDAQAPPYTNEIESLGIGLRNGNTFPQVLLNWSYGWKLVLFNHSSTVLFLEFFITTFPTYILHFHTISSSSNPWGTLKVLNAYSRRVAEEQFRTLLFTGMCMVLLGLV